MDHVQLYLVAAACERSLKRDRAAWAGALLYIEAARRPANNVALNPEHHQPILRRMSSPVLPPSFILSRAVAEDLSDILEVYFECFEPHERELFQGCARRDNLPRLRELYILDMQQQSSDIWLQVRETKSQRLIAASNWKLYASGKPDDRGLSVPQWLDEAALARSQRTLTEIARERRRHMQVPFLRTRSLEPTCRSRRYY